MFGRVRKIHFVGIGGIGMSGIAELLLNLGYEITGSDLARNEQTKKLEKLGARISYGHTPENVEGTEVVIISSAIRPDNIEVLRARELNIPVIKRAEMLSELMRMKYGVAIAGSHGKTTTTSIIARVMIDGGFDPTVIVGGKLYDIGSNARLGKGDYLIAEADESDGTFLMLMPYIAVITNVDKEHLDYYKDYERVLKAFAEFGNHIPFYGLTLACGDDSGVKEIIPFFKRRFLTYGFEEGNNIRGEIVDVKERGFSYKVWFKKELIGLFTISIPGKHNVLNSLAAIGVGLELGIPTDKIAKSLKKFGGVKRRLEEVFSSEDFVIIDDYGHHPTEIQNTITTVKEIYPGRKLVVAFQPHRYTRTRDLLQDFPESFKDADLLIITDIYPAGEKPIENITGETLYWEVKKSLGERVVYGATLVDVENLVKENLQPGDILLTLGAGNINKVGEEIKRWILKE